MTDTKAINSSDCAWMCDKLEDTQRKLGAITYKSHGSEISYLKLQAVLASHDLIYRLSQLQERLAKLEGSRALVAEQEQASAGEAISRAVDTLDEYANSQVAPVFAVGDTVMIKESWPWAGSPYLLEEVGIELVITATKILDYPQYENYDKKMGFVLSNGSDVAPSDLTLIRKANA